jgi:hypothetical protein
MWPVYPCSLIECQHFGSIQPSRRSHLHMHPEWGAESDGKAQVILRLLSTVHQIRPFVILDMSTRHMRADRSWDKREIRFSLLRV